MFRNLTCFTFPATLALDDLEACLATATLRPVGPMELASRGFVPPLGRTTTALAHAVGDAVWVAVGTETKILPPAVVSDLLAKRLAAIEAAEGRVPGGRTRKRIREEIVADLLPRALVKPGRVDAYLDRRLGLLVVDTASRTVADAVVSEVRRALGSFPALPLQASASVRAVLTQWLYDHRDVPRDLVLGDEAVLQDAGDEVRVAITGEDLVDSREVREHLAASKYATRLGVVLGERLRCTVGEDLAFRKFRLLDGALDTLESVEREDLRAELDARFALLVGEVRALLAVLAGPLALATSPDAPAAVNGSARAAAQRLDGKLREGGITATISGPGLAPVTLGDGEDPLLDAARDLVRATGRASISGVQRRLNIGYNRAARLIETLESEGVVSAPDARGDRTVREVAA